MSLVRRKTKDPFISKASKPKRQRRSAKPTDGAKLVRIGKMGENKFKDLCDRADLLCTKPTPDETAKDFVVEFPLAPYSALVSYDTRPAPIKVVVQVKTVTAQDRPAVLSLTAAERLTHDADPAIVCMFVYDDGMQELVDMRFIHFLGDNLERVLRALRRASASKKNSLHKSEISFQAKLGFEVQMTPSALKTALTDLVPRGMDAYFIEKRRQRLTAGYEDDRFKVSLSFSGQSEDETIDAFLGLRDIPVSEFSVAETRFKISLPFPEFTPRLKGGRLSITPDPIDHCDLIVRNERSNVSHEVPAQVFLVPAGLVQELPTYLLKWAMGRARVNYSSKSFTLTVEWDNETARTIADWRDQVRFVSCIFGGECNMSARGDGFVADLANFEWSPKGEADWLPRIDRLITASFDVLDRAGMSDREFTMSELVESRRTIAILDALATRNIKLTTESDAWDMPTLNEASGLFVSSAQIANHWVAFAIPMIISTLKESGSIKWTCYRSGEPTFQVITGDVEAGFERFRTFAQNLARPECAFVQPPGSFLADQGMILHTDLITDDSSS